MLTRWSDAKGHDLLHRRSFIRLGATVLSLLVGRAAHGAEPAGAIEDVKGEGFAESGSARRVLQREAPVFIADRVGTGEASRLIIQLGRQTKVRLGSRARMTIDRYLVDAGGELTLESGPLLFDRPQGAPPAPVQIRSPFGLIAVRGTRFFAGPSNGVFGVFVERGRVAVTAAGRSVVLQAGQGTDIIRPGAPPSPVTNWGPARIGVALDSVL